MVPLYGLHGPVSLDSARGLWESRPERRRVVSVTWRSKDCFIIPGKTPSKDSWRNLKGLES